MGIFSVIGILGKLVDPIGTVVKALASAYEKKQNATTAQDRIAASVEIRALEAKQKVLIAESVTPINAIVRALWVAPMVIYINKVVLWDKVFELGVTDNLSPDLWKLLWMMAAFYFLDTLARRFKK